MKLFRKQKTIIEKLEGYLSCIDICVTRFTKCMEKLMNDFGSEENYKIVQSVHEAESDADDHKRQIEYHLYEKALIPESRGDVLGIIEALDKIPNMMESICYQMLLQKICIPEEYKRKINELIEINVESYEQLKRAINGLFYNSSVMEVINRIDMIESESDKIERDLIEKIFNSDMDKADKLLFREIVINIGNISDRAQVVADRLTLAIIKRRI